MGFKSITFDDIFTNMAPHCAYLGKQAYHSEHVSDMFHCKHPTKVGSNFNWACTIESCPHFEARGNLK